MASVAEFFKPEKDVLYRQGKREGKLEGKREGKLEGKREGKLEVKKQFVVYLLQNTNKTAQQIADTADGPVAFVREVQAGLSKPS